MEILAQGKRKYVLGLNWAEVTGKPAQHIKTVIGSARGIYDVQRSDKGPAIVGTLKVATLPKGRLFSAAHAIAAQGVDGVFGIPHGGRAWYVVVTGGKIMPGTDVCLEFDEAITAMASLRDGLELPLCWAGAEPLPIPGCGTFDVSALDLAKIKPVQRAGESQLVGGIVLACVLAGVGYGGWKVKQDHDAPPADALALPVDEQAQIRDQYLAEVRRQASATAADTGWVVDAYAAAKSALPESLGGWMLKGFACQPGRCVGTYAGEPGRLLAPAVEAFGVDNVALSDGGKTMTITLQMPVAMVEWTDAHTQAPPRWDRPLADVAGRVPLHFAVMVDGEPVGAPLAVPPPGLPVVLRETIAVKSDYLDKTILAGVAHHFGADGFAASTLAVNGAAWRMELARFGSGQ